jgi:hypothetical protein
MHVTDETAPVTGGVVEEEQLTSGGLRFRVLRNYSFIFPVPFLLVLFNVDSVCLFFRLFGQGDFQHAVLVGCVNVIFLDRNR